MNIRDRVANVRDRVAAAAARAGRDPSDVVLVAVSKTFGVGAIAEAAEAGIELFGENRAQELKTKAAVLGARARWHFVGHLQTNKVRSVVGVAEYIHSVDRYGLGEAIARRAEVLGIEQRVFVEVNLAGEATKSGVDPARAPALAREIAELDGIVVRGVMAIPPVAISEAETREQFRRLAAIRDEIAAAVPGAIELSMGMSADFELAIEEGSTIVRVGEAIFGPRASA